MCHQLEKRDPRRADGCRICGAASQRPLRSLSGRRQSTFRIHGERSESADRGRRRESGILPIHAAKERTLPVARTGAADIRDLDQQSRSGLGSSPARVPGCGRFSGFPAHCWSAERKDSATVQGWNISMPGRREGSCSWTAPRRLIPGQERPACEQSGRRMHRRRARRRCVPAYFVFGRVVSPSVLLGAKRNRLYRRRSLRSGSIRHDRA